MLSVQELTFTYACAVRPAVRSLTFTILPGEIFGFLGPSGAGKSTTQKVLTGLLKGYQGRVIAFGKDLSAWGQEYYEHIGVAFEAPNHFLKLTALENLTYFGALYNRPIRPPMELLDRLGLQGDAHTPAAQFSKGMKQRLMVARALLHDPDLLFLDEPTGGLDPANSRIVKDLVLEQKRAGKTIFLTTHNMTIADELCDRVAFLVDGEIKLIDAPRQLKLAYGQPRVRVEFGSSGEVQVRDFPLHALGNDPAFLEILRAGDLQTIHSQEATLEDVFLRVTGCELD